MRSATHIGDSRAQTLVHRVEVEGRPPTPAKYTGMQFLSALGEDGSRTRSGARNRLAAQRHTGGFQLVRLQRPVRRYED